MIKRLTHTSAAFQFWSFRKFQLDKDYLPFIQQAACIGIYRCAQQITVKCQRWAFRCLTIHIKERVTALFQLEYRIGMSSLVG